MEISEFWNVSNEYGFLPNRTISKETAVQDSVPECLRDAIELSMLLGEIPDDTLRERVISLALPTTNTLSSLSEEEAEIYVRAYAFLAARMIHSDLLDPGRILQSSIAFPIWALSKRVHRPPSLTYASYVLANWDGSISPRSQPDEIDVSTTFTSTRDEEWFIVVHLAVESVGGEIVSGFDACRTGMLSKDITKVSAGLSAIESALLWAVSALARIDEQLDASVFTNQVRPFLFGYNDITLAGVTDTPRVTYVGETGAQSGVMRAADSGLGVRHTTAIGSPLERFLSYAPPSHRRYIEEVAELGENIRQLARREERVRSIYNNALVALAQFRTLHYSVVDRYLSTTHGIKPGFGTGGTAYQSWLRGLISETQNMILD